MDRYEIAYAEKGSENGFVPVPAEQIAHLRVLSSPDPRITGQVFALDRVQATVGRHACSHIDLVVNAGDVAVSRANSVFSFEAGRWFVWDNTSTNGTWLEGRPLANGERRPLEHGDVVSVGGQPNAQGEVVGGVLVSFVAPAR